MSSRRRHIKTDNGNKTSHHFRPRSRGGMDGAPNERSIDDKTLHHPYHTLFGNLRPNEAILLLLFSFQTICPYMERNESGTKNNRIGFGSRIKAWDAMFGESEDWDSLAGQTNNMKRAIGKIIKEFVKTIEDKGLATRAIWRGLDGGVLNEDEFYAYEGMIRSGN